MNHEELETMSPGLSSLISAEQHRPDAGDAARQRVFERLSATVAAAGGTLAASQALGSASPNALGATTSTAAGAAAGSAGGAAAGGWLLSKATAIALAAFMAGGVLGATTWAPLGAEPVQHAEKGIAASVLFAMPARGSLAWGPDTGNVAAAEPVSPPVQAALADPRVASAPHQAAHAPTRLEASAAVSPQDADEALASERAVLRRAFSAMSQGRWPSAIAALDEHAREFPAGRLKEQREAMMVQALRSAGKAGEASARRESFEREYPGSLLLESAPGATP